jgi:hypothetical protein
MSSKIGVSGTASAGTAAWSSGAVRRRTVIHTKNTTKIMSIHEHNLVPTIINDMRYFRCITCSTIYCQLCGKSLEASTTQSPCR